MTIHRGLREEMKIICASLQNILKREKKVGLINMMQFGRIKLQHYFYQWMDNVQGSPMRSAFPSVKSSTKNMRSTSSSGMSKRITPTQTYSIDETGKSKVTKKLQQKQMMGSFDLDSRTH
jgi:hypothetical protein